MVFSDNLLILNKILDILYHNALRINEEIVIICKKVLKFRETVITVTLVYNLIVTYPFE
jgi:hypothetical protein